MNGYEATRGIHAHRRGWKVPVLVVSADSVDYGSENWAFDAGFTAFLTGRHNKNRQYQRMLYRQHPEAPCFRRGISLNKRSMNGTRTRLLGWELHLHFMRSFHSRRCW